MNDPPSPNRPTSDRPSDDTVWGRDLEVEIRIMRDGRISFHDIPLDMLPVLRTLCPDDPLLAQREAAASAMLEKEPPSRE
ncbi:MAG: hypothetical protein JNL80_08075 [Phycisphaerae bacterium]|nr:hypothetical protein [Phycisphaerae bacterium]